MKAIGYRCIFVPWKYALPRRLVYNFGCVNFDLARVADLPLRLIICRHISILVSGISGMATIKINSWKTQCSIYFSPFLRKHFSGYGLARRGKNPYFCVMFDRLRCSEHALDDRSNPIRVAGTCQPETKTKSISSGKPILRFLKINNQNYRPITRVRHIFSVQLYTEIITLCKEIAR